MLILIAFTIYFWIDRLDPIRYHGFLKTVLIKNKKKKERSKIKKQIKNIQE